MIFSQIFPTMSATNNPSDWFQIFGADRNIYWKKCRSNKINSKLSPLLPWACYQPGLNLLFFAGGRCNSNICTLVGYGFEKCRKNSFEFIFLELHFKWFGTVFIFSTLHSPQCNPTTGYWFLSSIYSLNKACHLQESSETLFISTSWDGGMKKNARTPTIHGLIWKSCLLSWDYSNSSINTWSLQYNMIFLLRSLFSQTIQSC